MGSFLIICVRLCGSRREREESEKEREGGRERERERKRGIVEKGEGYNEGQTISF